MFEWIFTIESFRIDDRNGFLRNDLRDRMVIGDNAIDSMTFCILYDFYVSGSTVDSDDKTDTKRLEFIDKIGFQTISIFDPMWEPVADLHANLFEKMH